MAHPVWSSFNLSQWIWPDRSMMPRLWGRHLFFRKGSHRGSVIGPSTDVRTSASAPTMDLPASPRLARRRPLRVVAIMPVACVASVRLRFLRLTGVPCRLRSKGRSAREGRQLLAWSKRPPYCKSTPAPLCRQPSGSYMAEVDTGFHAQEPGAILQNGRRETRGRACPAPSKP